VQPTHTESDIKADLKALLSNGPWLVLFIAAIFALMNIAIRNGSLLYCFKYFVGDDGTTIFLIFGKTAILMSLGMATMMCGIFADQSACRALRKTSPDGRLDTLECNITGFVLCHTA